MELAANKELAKHPSRRVVAIRRCIHELPDGSVCRAAAVKGSPRCRHHQFDFRLPERMALSDIAADDRNRKFVATKARELLSLPFREAVEQLHRWEQLGIISRGRAKQLRYALQMNVVAQRMRDNERFGSGGQSI